MWYKDEFLESMYLEKDNRVICALHPKPTLDYIYHVGIKFFGTEEKFDKWYYKRNWWYGDIAPVQMSDKKVINLLCNMAEGVPI